MLWSVLVQFEDINKGFPHKAVEFNHVVVAIRLFCISVASETFAIVVCMTEAFRPVRHNL